MKSSNILEVDEISFRAGAPPEVVNVDAHKSIGALQCFKNVIKLYVNVRVFSYARE